eukprot:13771122-Ditylum_brightwellii.AAC.1
MVDNDASLFMQNHPIDLKPTANPILFPTTTAHLEVLGSTVTSNSLDLLLESYSDETLGAYIRTKTSMAMSTFNIVGWTALGKALNDSKL